MGHHSQIISAVKYNVRQVKIKGFVVWSNFTDYIRKSDNFIIYDYILNKKGYEFIHYKTFKEIPLKFKPFAKKLTFVTNAGKTIFYVIQYKSRNAPYIRGGSKKCMDNDEWINLLKNCNEYKEEYCLKSNELVYFF